MAKKAFYRKPFHDISQAIALKSNHISLVAQIAGRIELQCLTNLPKSLTLSLSLSLSLSLQTLDIQLES